MVMVVILSLCGGEVGRKGFRNAGGQGVEVDRKKDRRERWRAMENDGLAAVGDWLHSGDLIVNRHVPKVPPANNRENKVINLMYHPALYREAPVSWKGPPGEPCVVERVIITQNHEFDRIVKVRAPSLPTYGGHAACP